jgi:predicted aspartyl protease
MRISRVATLLSGCLSAAAATAAPGEIAVSVLPSGAVRVPVGINGHGPFRLLLDTGSGHSTLSRELSESLALPVVAQVRVSTPAGAGTQLVVRVERMSVGDASVQGLLPSIVSLAELRELEPGVDGVIGQDFLKEFDFTVDYRRMRLLFGAAEAGEERTRVPLVRAGDRPLVQLPGLGPRAPVLMVPDSGSAGFVIFERDGLTAVSVEDLGEPAVVSALGMRQAARGAVLRELQVGGITLRNQPAVVVAREGSSAIEPDGLMPLHGFSSVSFNNSQGYLVVRK